MSTLAANVKTLADWTKEVDPDGKPAQIVELLSQTNDILMDMMWKEGNLPTGERTSIRTGLPAAAWRLINQGVQPSKATSVQVDEACGILEAWSEIDKDLVELNGNTTGFLLSESRAFLEAMSQEFASTLIYGNSSISPEEFTGLAIRYSSLSANNGQNIVSGSGTDTDMSSIWLVVWGDQTVHGIFPKGSQAGLVHEDLGLQTVQTSTSVAGTRLRAYQNRFQWKCGIALKDWRYVVRIANIDISNLVAKSSAADLIDLMIKAIYRIPNLSAGKPVFYMNRSCMQMLDIQRRDDIISGGGLVWDTVDGKRVATFRGIPIRLCDALLETETQIS